MTLRRATKMFREVGSLPLLLLALLLVASGDLSAQDRARSRDNDSSDGGRVAVPRGEGSPTYSAPSQPSSPPRSASPSPGDSGSSSSGRYAVPGSPGDARRRPSSHDRYDGHRGGGGYDRNYYPRWYGYYGPGWWWSPYGYWGGWWLGDNWWPYYGPHYGDRYDDRYDGDGGGEAGALDLDLSPGRVQVYVDGQYLGIVDQYDGWPSYLWLEKGTYDIVFYLDGYKTLARQVTIYPGTVVGMGDSLEPGPSVRPEDLPTKTHERRDARERYEAERRERIERGGSSYDDESDEDWRDRVRRGREADRTVREEEEVEIEEQGDRPEQARLRLEVEPSDASVYLDGHFVGTAEDLAHLRRGLLIEPGKHTVAVVRPGHESVEKEIEVEEGEDFALELDLKATGR